MITIGYDDEKCMPPTMMEMRWEDGMRTFPKVYMIRRNDDNDGSGLALLNDEMRIDWADMWHCICFALLYVEAGLGSFAFWKLWSCLSCPTFYVLDWIFWIIRGINWCWFVLWRNVCVWWIFAFFWIFEFSEEWVHLDNFLSLKCILRNSRLLDFLKISSIHLMDWLTTSSFLADAFRPMYNLVCYVLCSDSTVSEASVFGGAKFVS